MIYVKFCSVLTRTAAPMWCTLPSWKRHCVSDLLMTRGEAWVFAHFYYGDGLRRWRHQNWQRREKSKKVSLVIFYLKSFQKLVRNFEKFSILFVNRLKLLRNKIGKKFHLHFLVFRLSKVNMPKPLTTLVISFHYSLVLTYFIELISKNLWNKKIFLVFKDKLWKSIEKTSNWKQFQGFKIRKSSTSIENFKSSSKFLLLRMQILNKLCWKSFKQNAIKENQPNLSLISKWMFTCSANRFRGERIL